MMNPGKRPPRLLGSVGTVLLLALALSSVGHWWHHVTDASCESSSQSFPHPCAQCSALHGGVLAEAHQPTPAPPASRPNTVVVVEDADRIADLHSVGSPRAPPGA